MAHSPAKDSELARRRVDQALNQILRPALVKYLSDLPRASRAAYGSLDVQRLLDAFIDRFPELLLPRSVRTLAFAAKDARNETAHYTGNMTPDRALRHLANVRQLLEDLDADEAFTEADRLYAEQLDAFRRPDVMADTASPRSDAPQASDRQSSATLPVTQDEHTVRGKYGALYRHLTALTEQEWRATFLDVEIVLGSTLPRSARSHQAWWSNTTTHSHAKSWLWAGWRTRNVNLNQETLLFVRSGNASTHEPARSLSSGLVFFEDDDAGYLDWVSRNRDGYVVNVRRTLTPDYVILHRATCSSISASHEAGAYTERSYRKLCGRTMTDVVEAPLWCGRHRGSFTKRCSLCKP